MEPNGIEAKIYAKHPELRLATPEVFEMALSEMVQNGEITAAELQQIKNRSMFRYESSSALEYGWSIQHKEDAEKANRKKIRSI